MSEAGPGVQEQPLRPEAKLSQSAEMLRNAVLSRLTQSSQESSQTPHQRTAQDLLRDFLGISPDQRIAKPPGERQIPFDQNGEIEFKITRLRKLGGEIGGKIIEEITEEIIIAKKQETDENGNQTEKIRVYRILPDGNREEVQIYLGEKGQLCIDDQEELRAKAQKKQQSSESPQTQTEGEEKKENEEQKPAEADSSKAEEQITIEPLSEEDARKYIEISLIDAVYGDVIAKDPQKREALRRVLAGEELARADLEALAERFGFITPTLLGKAFESLGIPSADKTGTDENGQIINLRQALKTALEAKEKSKQLSPEEKRKLEIIRKLESAPAILTGKDVAEIFAVIDPDAFEGKNADQITIGDILRTTYQKMTGEEKKALRAKKTEIEKQRKQKTQEGQQTNEQLEEQEETPQDTEQKQEQQQVEEQQIESDIKALLETLGIETEEVDKFLGKSLARLIDENNEAIQKGEEKTIEVEDLKNFIDIFSEHKKALELYKQEIQNRLNTAGKVGIGVMAVLLMLIWASSKDRQQGGMH